MIDVVGRIWGHAAWALLATGVIVPVAAARATDLYRPGVTQSLAGDRRAMMPGDLITIVIVQAAEASSTVQSGTQRSSSVTGRIDLGGVDESGDLSLGGAYRGRGETRRSERFVTQMTATIAQVLPNGDLVIGGGQHFDVNGEATFVAVRGRVRAADIDGENRVPSNRIADARIDYDGKGFVSRGARPGLIQRLFALLGLG
ncbi:MAG: flagellar basal body L-ring protein FlgH [Sphingomonas adhaesiva]|uniref:flagellar basal body L-ring protein FlgH n=1 Tax=Sphingomonas adhaesiva TaxID=28212 RepID=UPI002FFD1A8A